VIAEQQGLSAPEKRVVFLKASSVLGSVIEPPEDLERALSRLKEELEKLLREGVRVVLEESFSNLTVFTNRLIM